MLGIEFFRRATDAGAMGGETPLDEMLSTWGIDADAFLSWLVVYCESVDDRSLAPDENVTCALLAGFETGYRARLAVEEAAVL